MNYNKLFSNYLSNVATLPSGDFLNKIVSSKLNPFFEEIYDIPHNNSSSNYPPYNLVKVSDIESEIQLAIAGFKRDEITVSLVKDCLTISGKKRGMETSTESSEKTDLDVYPKFLLRGIASRKFSNKFQLSPYTIVNGVTLEDGILTIKLKKENPENNNEQIFTIS